MSELKCEDYSSVRFDSLFVADVLRLERAMDLSPTPDWHGFAVVRRRPRQLDVASMALCAIPAGWRIEFAGNGVRDWDAFARDLLVGPDCQPPERILVHGQAANHVYRAAAFTGDCLTGAVLIEPRPLAVRRDWLVARLDTTLDAGESFRLMDGRPSGAMTGLSVLVCVCCQVTRDEIVAAIGSGCTSVQAVGAATRAGTHCGGCRPKITGLIEAAAI